MEKNIQYLYEHRNGKRVRNIGFMKIENQMDRSTIHVYAKQMDEIKGILFQKADGETYIGSWEAEEVSESQEISSEKPPVASMETEVVEEYIVPSAVKYEKIQRKDISRLPRKEWRLANNSFLLHGFYNYHHLLYIEDDSEIWIGVPGVFHEKEQMAANAFGFTEFRRLTDIKIDLEENEKNTYEDFGYWCRQIPIS